MNAPIYEDLLIPTKPGISRTLNHRPLVEADNCFRIYKDHLSGKIIVQIRQGSTNDSKTRVYRTVSTVAIDQSDFSKIVAHIAKSNGWRQL